MTINNKSEIQMYSIGKETNTIFDKTMNYLDGKYEIRFNEIALSYEIKLRKEFEWKELNLNSLFIELMQAEISISIKNLEILVKSNYVLKYDPIDDYFQNIIWDGNDHISYFLGFLKTSDNDSLRIQLEKWLVRAIRCALIPGYVNKQCLVLVSPKQNTGKTTLLRFLCPNELREYYTENVSTDKDGVIAICKNFIANADEFASFSKADANTLKAYISKDSVNMRLPYGRKAERMERICSFVASTNRTDFLTDSTGSVRWLVYEIKEIDFEYSKKVDIDQVWAQAYHLAYNDKDYKAEMTPEELKENEERNQAFRQLSEEEEIIRESYIDSNDIHDGFMTATEVKLQIKVDVAINPSIVRVGKALTSLKFKRVKHPKRQVYGYLIKEKRL